MKTQQLLLTTVTSGQGHDLVREISQSAVHDRDSTGQNFNNNKKQISIKQQNNKQPRVRKLIQR